MFSLKRNKYNLTTIKILNVAYEFAQSNLLCARGSSEAYDSFQRTHVRNTSYVCVV